MAVTQRQSSNPQSGMDIPGLTRPMTYDEYLASPEEMRRYDIIDGWKLYRTYGGQHLPNPTRRHQIIQGNLFVALRACAMMNGLCRAIIAPCDVLINSSPIRFRQPDILVISNTRWEQNLPSDNPAPLSPPPELVVEIVSPSETAISIREKLEDYSSAGVDEVWIIRDEDQTVDIRLINAEAKTVTMPSSSIGRTATSHIFDGFTIPYGMIFAD